MFFHNDKSHQSCLLYQKLRVVYPTASFIQLFVFIRLIEMFGKLILMKPIELDIIYSLPRNHFLQTQTVETQLSERFNKVFSVIVTLTA